jgi:hypothetical protein
LMSTAIRDPGADWRLSSSPFTKGEPGGCIWTPFTPVSSSPCAGAK